MKYNRELEYINTEEKAYFLGQIYGDGCNNCVPKGHKVTMASINTDAPLYKKLQQLFPFFKFTTYPSHSKVVYLECYEKALCMDLKEHGMISNKTIKDATREFHFPMLRQDLIHHFIRGYFDADGAAYLPKRKRSRNNLRIEFGCATPNFLRDLQRILGVYDIKLNWYERDKKAGNGKYYRSYCIISSDHNISRRFADFIYKDATIYLERKKEICYTEPTYRPLAADIYGNCPYCGSSHITRAGIRAGKRRLVCRDCNKRFTRPLPK